MSTKQKVVLETFLVVWTSTTIGLSGCQYFDRCFFVPLSQQIAKSRQHDSIATVGEADVKMQNARRL